MPLAWQASFLSRREEATELNLTTLNDNKKMLFKIQDSKIDSSKFWGLNFIFLIKSCS